MPPPPKGSRNDVTAWMAAIDNAKAQLISQKARYVRFATQGEGAIYSCVCVWEGK